MKLGARMLSKYPGITLVGGISMAFAIWFGTVTFELLGLFLFPQLPLPGGDRIVQVYNWDTKATVSEKRVVHDLLIWREQLKSVTDIGAYRNAPRNLAVPGTETREILVAEMTASGFTVSSAKPLMGRTLKAADERGEAPPVVVLGYDVWKDRLGADPAILGKSVKLGDSFASVVGVMGKGYAFPIAHEAWVPLRLEQLDRTPRSGASIDVFGRLADGATMEEAQKELDLIGRRLATQFKATHEHLKPMIASYVGDDDPSSDQIGMAAIPINIALAALMALICGNVALLIFARSATRETELTVRSALGASRGRIIMQLFAEALVLGLAAAVVGLIAAGITLRLYGMPYLEMNYDMLPFWYETNLSPMAVVYAFGLAVFGAVIAGVLPALKVTRGISQNLRQGTAGSGLRFSGVWTFVIVAQVAATVLLPAIVALTQNELSRVKTYDYGFQPKNYLAVQLETDAPGNDGTPTELEAHRARTAATLQTLSQRLAGEPGVRGVTFTNSVPGTSEGGGRIAFADSTQLPPGGERVSGVVKVDVNYFNVLGVPIVSGRGFHSGDVTEAARNVIVDLRFVERALGGANPLGRRMRIGKTDSSWWEIVGVVRNAGIGSPVERNPPMGIYKPVALGAVASPAMMIHVAGDPLAMAPRLREIAGAVDPNLRLNQISRVDMLTDPLVSFIKIWRHIMMILTGVAVLLSLAGIYAVLSFTVSKRTREIGVRVAVGATPRKIVATIFKRPIIQVSTGIVIGAFLVGLGSVVVRNHKPDSDMGMHTLAGGLSIGQLATLIGYAALMLGVCLLACIVPTRRALRVQPTEALRAE
jgi:predicted permease